MYMHDREIRTVELVPVFCGRRGDYRGRNNDRLFGERVAMLCDEFVKFCRNTRPDIQFDGLATTPGTVSLEWCFDIWIEEMMKSDWYYRDAFKLGWEFDFGPMVPFVFILAANRLMADPHLLDYVTADKDGLEIRQQRTVSTLLEPEEPLFALMLYSPDPKWPTKHIVTPTSRGENSVYG